MLDNKTILITGGTNLALKIWIKRLALKTICLSHSIELHETGSGAFIEKALNNG